MLIRRVGLTPVKAQVFNHLAKIGRVKRKLTRRGADIVVIARQRLNNKSPLEFADTVMKTTLTNMVVVAMG